MKRLLILGDTHGSTNAMLDAFIFAAQHDVDAIVQVGDFGYWPQLGGERFLHQTAKWAGEYNTPVYWVDGNHEDFATLYERYGQDHLSPVQVKPLVYWLPRGVLLDWEGVRILAMGGAASIDRQWRVLGHSWFHEEMISDEDVEKTAPADIVISHDAPINPLEAGGYRFIIDENSEFCRQQMRRVVSIAQPELVLHGHYHMYSDNQHLHRGGYTRVVGLECDGNYSNKALLTLDNGSWDLTAPLL